MLPEIKDPKLITVEVAYATCEKQEIKQIRLPHGATIEDGIINSGILNVSPDICLSKNKVGIFGAIKPLDHILQQGDRIEIYRALDAASSK